MSTPRPSARALIEQLLDPGSFVSWDVAPTYDGPGEEYSAELAAAAERSGADEAVLTGTGTIQGERVAVVVSEFRFLAGSIGCATAERIVAAIERATVEGLPLLGLPASGGTRMQEGTPAFVRMVGIAAAVAAHRAAGLPYLVHLRNPTTGGVMASWASLGHVTVAEPGALAGFLGPKVYRALEGEDFPAGVQTSENLHRHGIVDLVGSVADFRDVVRRVLGVLRSTPAGAPAPGLPDPVAPDAWDAITRTRRADRPGVRDLLRHVAGDVVALHGSGVGETAPGLLLALASFGGAPCVVVGQDRSYPEASGPEALRVAARGARLAADLRLPLVSIVDTRGAALSVAAEEGALAAHIARSLADLVTLPTPTLCLLLGEGTGGGALALLPADRVLATEHAWLSPLPPEGASVIRHGDTSHAAATARAQQVGAFALRDTGLVDRIVPEAADPDAFCRAIGAVLAEELAGLGPVDLVARARRFRGGNRLPTHGSRAASSDGEHREHIGQFPRPHPQFLGGSDRRE